MLFLSFRHMAGGFSIQKGLFEGISRKLERCTSPDTLALVQNSWLLPLFFISTLFRHIPPLLSLPPPVFSFPYSFFFLSLSLNHPSTSPDVALFRHVCFAQADSWPAQSWCHALFKEENHHELLRGLTVLSFFLKTSRPVEMVHEQF